MCLPPTELPSAHPHHERIGMMSEFDLDVRTDGPPAAATSRITSKSLCTPGCITGPLHCSTGPCSGGCSIAVSR